MHRVSTWIWLAGGLAAAFDSGGCRPSPGSQGSSSTDTDSTDSTDGTGDSTTQAATGAATTVDPDTGTGGSSTGGTDPCTTPLGDDPEPLFGAPRGRFALRSAPGYSNFRGAVYGDDPVDFLHETERRGACRLLRYTPSSCEPQCVPPALCIDGACVTPPSRISVGDVTLEGATAESIVISESPLHDYFWEYVGDLAPTVPSIVATGGDLSGFSMSACPTTAPLADGDWSALLQARATGQDVVLTWSDPVATARVYLRMTTGIGTHGGISPVEVECEGPDLGMLTLPGGFLDALYADGWACGECGGNDLVRYHADRTGDAMVEFRTEAVTTFWFIP